MSLRAKKSGSAWASLTGCFVAFRCLAMTRKTTSAAVARILGLVGVGGGRRLRHVGEAGLQLLLDLLEIVGFRLEVARMRPLELGLQRAADPPVGVAEMVVDGRIDRLELDGALELLDGLVVVADPVPGPAERIDDIAVIGPLLDRALDHAHALVEIEALIDPGIAEIVQHVRLVGIKLERLLEIGLGLAPLLRALEAD